MLCRILTKEATRGPESKQQTSDREQSKKQIILFTRANLFSPGQNITLVCIGTAFPSLSNAIRVKNQFKEDSKTLKTTKEATKVTKYALFQFIFHQIPWPKPNQSNVDNR